MSRYLDSAQLAEIGNVIISITAAYLLIAGAIIARRLITVGRRAIAARKRTGRSVKTPPTERPNFFDGIDWDWPA